MQVSLTTPGGLERRLEVAVPGDRVTTEVESRLKQLSRTARLKGFRPGKAPYAVIQKQFGEQVRTEVVGDLIRSSYAEAVNQEKLTPAGGPRIELQPGGDLKYTATFEVLPEVRLSPVGEIAIERPSAKVEESDVDAMIESMRKQRPVFNVVERAAQDTDRVTVDYTSKVGDTPLKDGDGKDVSFIIGAGRVMKELEEAVKGAKAGESRPATVDFPAEHPNKELAGKQAVFDLNLKQVEEQVLPEVNEEFMAAFGVKEGGVEALRTEVRQSMNRELEELVRNRLRTQVLEALSGANKFDVPKALIEEQIQQLQLDMARRANIQDPSLVPPASAFEESARRRVALGLILGEIVKSENLKVDRERVQARLNDLAAAYPNPDEVRRAYLQNTDAMRQIESAVLEDQVVDWVVGKAKINEKPATFSELTGFGQSQTGSVA